MTSEEPATFQYIHMDNGSWIFFQRYTEESGVGPTERKRTEDKWRVLRWTYSEDGPSEGIEGGPNPRGETNTSGYMEVVVLLWYRNISVRDEL